MKINVKATNIKLTDNIQKYLDKKLSSLDKLINKDDTSVLCEVEVSKINDRHKSGDDLFRSEINLHIAGKNFRAVSEESTLFSAIDETKDQMQKELRRHKEKKEHLMKRGGAKVKDMMRDE